MENKDTQFKEKFIYWSPLRKAFRSLTQPPVGKANKNKELKNKSTSIGWSKNPSKAQSPRTVCKDQKTNYRDERSNKILGDCNTNLIADPIAD